MNTGIAENGIVWKIPTKPSFPKKCSKSSGADCKQTQETQKRYDTDFRRIDKMCRLRMVFSLWGKQAEQNPYGYYHCSKNGQGLRQCSMHYIRYDVLYAISSFPVWLVLGTFLDEENFETISLPFKSAVPDRADFGVRVCGDSMEPVYHDGQIA